MSGNGAAAGLKTVSLESVVASLQADVARIEGEVQMLRATNDTLAHIVRGLEAKLGGRD
ncbi:hypothetical protein I5U59_15150 [Stenotrophomonas maltophilia]|uniref:hypothetical protein n=1 Tax=Kitasatospora sp. NPDC056446 TaxID=3345819 RepID=UPI0018D3A85A|nr:hypothetical protein [Stenotrophomonas maltophilia]MBH1504408.1 hypothetical protein [Stenotrophomonas maltophilia]MBH1783984.1 hypothetical protein [Stenotrophomonas maltophilia]